MGHPQVTMEQSQSPYPLAKNARRVGHPKWGRRRFVGNTVVITGAFRQTRLSEWLAENGDRVGRQYAPEVGRHY